MTRRARKPVQIYARLYSAALRDPKLAGRSHLAWRLCVSSWAYCREKGNDGEIEPGALIVIVPGETKRKLQMAASELVEGMLWDSREGGGWTIHNYLRYQDGADKIAANIEHARVAADARWEGE